MKEYVFKLLVDGVEKKTWFNASSYDEAYSKMKAWVKDHFGTDVELELIDYEENEIDNVTGV